MMIRNQAAAVKKEYEEFTYIVSHDLNAPLRHVKEFSKLLVESLPADLNDEQREYTEFLDMALARLDLMQQALLDYSRVNTRAEPHREFSAEEVVEEALESLAENIARSSVKVSVGDLPEVSGDINQIKKLFFHLLDNAIKFYNPETRKREISISAEEGPKEVTFIIADNGTGMDMKHHDEAFKLFRRLHTSPNYEGVGAGLAIAKKIVDRHEGRIWFESEKNKGTTVYFTLPA